VTDPAPTDGGHRSIGQVLGTARGALGATATLATGVLGVVFLLVPSWRPLARDQIRASLTVPVIETRVGLLDWARRQYPGDPMGTLVRLVGHRLDAEDKGFEGLVVYVSLQSEGFKHRAIRLRARVYNTRTQRPDGGLDPDQMAYPETSRLQIDAPSRSSVQLLLLDDFSDVGGTYFVRVEAYDDDGILAYADSRQIPAPAGGRR